MSPEELQVHRELQLLRAAGVSAASRRRKRRPKPVNAGAEKLMSWVGSRGRLLDEADDVAERAGLQRSNA